MQENKVHILCTRLLNEAILQKAAFKNINIDTVSFIETQIPDDAFTVERMQLLSRENITAIFTSSNAAEAVIKAVPYKVNWKIFCLGGITKELVRQHFGKDSIAGTARNAAGLAEKIIAGGSISEAVFFCGDQHLSFLPKALRENNIQLEQVIVYKTILIPRVIEKHYDGIVFFSPSAAHSFFSCNTISQKIVLFAIGSTTAAAIQSWCTNTIITGEWPGKEQLIDKAIQYFEAINGENELRVV